MKEADTRTKTYRMTRQRRVILDCLQTPDFHPSAEEVYAEVRKKLPRVSLATVYRNLDILVEQGLIQKLELGGAQNRYDGETKRHYHIRCLKCGRIDNAPLAPLNQLEDNLYGATVYTITGHRLEFTGLCPACAREEEALATF